MIEAVDTELQKASPLTSTSGRLNVNSLNDDPLVNAAKNGKAFIWSTTHTSSTDENVIYLRNTSSTELLHIANIHVGGKANALFTLNSVTGLGSGSDSNEFNMNFSGGEADAVHLAEDVTDVGVLTPIAYRNVSDFDEAVFTFQRALVLGQGDAIAVQISKGGSDTIANIMGYFSDI